MRPPIEAFAERAATGGLFLDFDGTLSAIVQRPEDARPLSGVADVLTDLAERFALVAIVSGRSAHQIAGWLGPSIEIWGLHGAERAIGGRVELADAVTPYLDAIATARTEAVADFERLGLVGCIVEDKSAMLGLHFRNSPDPAAVEASVREVAEKVAERHGLTVVGGRMVFEIRPPVPLDKRDVVARRARDLELTAVCFVGDDLVDLPAFDALDELESGGALCVRVAVRSEESPPELIERADVVVDGPPGVQSLLLALAEVTTAR